MQLIQQHGTADYAYAIYIVCASTLMFLCHRCNETGTPKETYKVSVMRIPGAIEAKNYKVSNQW
jgi:hypothetical protein